MNRSEFNYKTQKSFSELESIINDLLVKEGYKFVDYPTGEKVWKRGSGMLEASQYIKIEYGVGEITIYGWISAFKLQEQDLTGFVGGLPKKKALKVINSIKNII